MNNTKKIKITVWVLFGLFTLFLLYETVLCRSVKPERAFDMIPFWSYREWARGDRYLGIQIIENILVFMPFGFLFAAGIDNGTKSGKRLTGKTALVSCAFSVSIELLQLVFMLGHCDIDDVMDNTLGGVLGCLVYLWIVSVIKRHA